MQVKGIDKNTGGDRDGKAYKKEEVTPAVRSGFLYLRLLAGRLETFQMPFVVAQDRFFVNPDGLGVFPDEVSCIDGRGKIAEIPAFQGCQVDQADPGGVKNVG